ncbi:hypothetical protein ACL9RL_10875 [Plantibacter sp. Mn2098]|uniref:hypothetical protein n=1 Tax=Plantibacter sp. Mn2098 TaxID=3395266 RepID=UPI003BD1D605
MTHAARSALPPIGRRSIPSAHHRPHDGRPLGRRASGLVLAAALAFGAVTAAGLGAGSTPANAAGSNAAESTDIATPITNATFEWGVNDQHQLGSQFGGCDYFSAGLSDGSAGQYRTQQGNVQIIKRAADGSVQAVGLANRCTPASSGSLDNGQHLLFTKGTGSTDAASGATTISWTGVATVNSYGGLVPWSITDPKLTVAADGTGHLTATVGGWASSMDDPNTKNPLPPTPDVTLADFSEVQVSAAGITATPLFAGIDYFPLVDGVRSTVSAISDQVKIQRPGWGSWPQSFVDFQYRTGLSTYWHTSGLSADAKKPPLPVTFAFDQDAPSTAPVIVRPPADVTVSEGATATFQTEQAGSPAPTLQWQTKRGDAAWTDVAGATATTLTMPSVAFTDDGLRVRAVSSNSIASTPSAAATLTVHQAAGIQILKQPQSVTAKAGAIVRLSVTVAGSSPQYQWQRSTDSGTTWANWGTATATSGLIPTASVGNNGDQYRVLVSNGVSDPVTSDVATITITTQAATITENQVDAIGFVGGKVIFRAYGSGAPDPTWEWQRSTDGGASWKTWSANASSLIYVEHLTADMNGNLFRAVAANGAGPDAVSAPTRLTVLPETERTVAFSPSAEIDPAGRTVLALSGAGFRVPDSYASFLRVGIVEASVWGDGSKPDKDMFVGDSGSVFASTLKRDDGAFARTLVIAAGQLDPAKRYVLASFSAAAGDGSLTNAVPIVLRGQDVQSSAAPKTLDDPKSGKLAASDLGLVDVKRGAQLTVKHLEPNSWFFATAHSEATPLGWHRTDADGSFTVIVPESLDVATHSLVVQNTAGVFRAWQSFGVLAADLPPVDPPVDPPVVVPPVVDPPTTAKPTPGAVDAGSSSGPGSHSGGSLSSTGFAGALPLLIAAVALLLGAGILAIVRLRRSRR